MNRRSALLQLKKELPHHSTGSPLQLQSVTYTYNCQTFIVGTVWSARKEGRTVWLNDRSKLISPEERSFKTKEDAIQDILDNVSIVKVPVVKELASSFNI